LSVTVLVLDSSEAIIACINLDCPRAKGIYCSFPDVLAPKFQIYTFWIKPMQSLLNKALFASVTLAGFGLMAAPQAQAATFDTLTFDAFFAGGTLTTNNFSATGVSSTVSRPASNVFLEEFSSVSAALAASTAPTLEIGTWTMAYNFTSLNGTGIATSSFIASPAGTTNATLEKYIYTDSTKSTLLGIASTTQNNQTSDTTPLIFGPLTNFYVEDVVTISNGGIAGISNSYDVPEPLTMLGASAAIALGAAFKRRQANKG
jgi:hypothetical protein